MPKISQIDEVPCQTEVRILQEITLKLLNFLNIFIPGLSIKQLLISMYMEDTRFQDKGKGFEITQGRGREHNLHLASIFVSLAP